MAEGSDVAAAARANMEAAAAGPSSESITVYARLKPVGSDSTKGDVEIPKRFNKQKTMNVRCSRCSHL